MSPFPTFSPKDPKRPELTDFTKSSREEVIERRWTFLSGLVAQEAKVPSLPASVASSGSLLGFDSSGYLVFIGTIAHDVSLTNTSDITVGTAPPQTQVSVDGVTLINDASAPLRLQWFDSGALAAVNLRAQAGFSGSIDHELLAAIGGSLVVSGNDAPSVAVGSLGKVDLTAQTANIASTALSNAPPAGVYELEVYLMCTTGDAAAGTLTVTIGWTDNVGATTSTPITGFALTATGRTTGRQIVRVASGDITYAVAITGAYGTSAYAIYVRVVALG